MKVFITGATGYIGSVVAEKLRKAGHQVSGLARSDTSAATLIALGIEPLHGDLGDAEILTAAAQAADGVIHAGFKLNEKGFAAAVADERRAVQAILAGLVGSGKPLVVTSGTGMLGDTGSSILDEEVPVSVDVHGAQGPLGDEIRQAARERLSMEQEVLKAEGLRGVVIRPPSVYGRSDGRSLLTALRAAGHVLGAVPYAAGGAERKWSFVHVEDLADLYVLALEKAAKSGLFHAGAESGLEAKRIAEALSQGMGLAGKTVALDPEELEKAVGPFMAGYWSSNSQCSGEKARRLLGWVPVHTDMLAELAKPFTH